MDWGQLFAELAGLTTFVFAATAQIKQFGVKGTALTASAFGVGLAFGGAYRYFVYAPSTGLDWFMLVVFGFLGGFLATGAYKGLENASGKGASRASFVYNLTTSTGNVGYEVEDPEE